MTSWLQGSMHHFAWKYVNLYQILDISRQVVVRSVPTQNWLSNVDERVNLGLSSLAAIYTIFLSQFLWLPSTSQLSFAAVYQSNKHYDPNLIGILRIKRFNADFGNVQVKYISFILTIYRHKVFYQRDNLMEKNRIVASLVSSNENKIHLWFEYEFVLNLLILWKFLGNVDEIDVLITFNEDRIGENLQKRLKEFSLLLFFSLLNLFLLVYYWGRLVGFFWDSSQNWFSLSNYIYDALIIIMLFRFVPSISSYSRLSRLGLPHGKKNILSSKCTRKFVRSDKEEDQSAFSYFSASSSFPSSPFYSSPLFFYFFIPFFYLLFFSFFFCFQIFLARLLLGTVCGVLRGVFCPLVFHV